ncbi:MAG: patatin-like phospholipase family protein, partial [Bacteroidota bacterium]|nr:patatin-like phospholipase family protein [Bacteroidota bacterium]
MKQKVALVLSSGGARGVAHIGVIEELLNQGYDITSISGTSMGALVGGMYATGKIDIFKEWMCSLDKMDVFNLVDFTINTSGIVKGNKVITEMKRMIPDINIEDLNIPYSAVATDVLSEKEIVFSSGSLYEAIRASISIPSVFVPFKLNNWQLIDGGVLNPIPINRVERKQDDILVVVDVNSRIPITVKKETKEKTYSKSQSKYIDTIYKKINHLIPKNHKDKVGYFNLLSKTSSLMLHKISDLTLEQYHPDILINVSRKSFGTFDFYKSKELI